MVPESLPVLAAHRDLMALRPAKRRRVVTGAGGAQRLADAGITWEALAGWLQGPMDKAAWEAVIPSMGAMALVRNLRNFDEAGVSDEVAAQVAAKISDPAEVARSRQFPFRYLAAYQHAPSLRWSYPLEQALGHSLANVPALPGRTLVLVDRSGSMFYSRLSDRSELNRADAAAIFGTALALRAADADLVEFGTSSNRMRVPQGRVRTEGARPLRRPRRHQHHRGRAQALQEARPRTDRHGRAGRVQPLRRPDRAGTGERCRSTPGTWPATRRAMARPGRGNRHVFGGLSDAAFRMVPLLESARDADWPWVA